MKIWWTESELAGLPGLPTTRRGVGKVARKQGWQSRGRAGRGGGREYHVASLPPTARHHLAPQLAAGIAPPPALLVDESTHSSVAEDRLRILTMVDILMQHGASKTDAVATVATKEALARATIYRWFERVINVARDEWLAALEPAYNPHRRRADCDDEAWDFFKADYLRLEQPSATACYRRLKSIAAVRAWAIPSCAQTLLRRVEAELSREAILLARKGVRALARTSPAQLRDHSVFAALEAVNADGHQLDVFVKWPNGLIGRPHLIAWQDILSGKLLSWRFDSVENSHAVRLAFGDLLDRYGIPSHAYLDNGRAFAAKWLTGGTPNRYRFTVREGEPRGLLTNLGVQVHWATPYHGQAKPIERAFRDLAENLAKHPRFIGAYVGNSPMAKPENYGSRAVDLEVFLEVAREEILAHNARAGRRSPVCDGVLSFDQAFDKSYAAATIRKPAPSQRHLWLLTAEQVRANKDTGAIKILDNVYWAEPLKDFAGASLVVRFDPDNLKTTVHVYTDDERYICEAKCEEAVGFNDVAAASERRREVNRVRRARREELEANVRISALDALQTLPRSKEPVIPTPAATQLANPRMFERPPELALTVHDASTIAAGEAAVARLDARRSAREENERAELAIDDANWLRYWTLRNSGVTVSDADAMWMRSYASTSHFRGRMLVEKDFGRRAAEA